MRILIGTNNIANILEGFHNGFKALGHDVCTVVKEPSKYYSNKDFVKIYRKWDHVKFPIGIINRVKEKIDYTRQNKRLRKYLYESLPHTDLYLFVWSSFMPDWEDLKILKEHGKKIIIAFAGSEVRYSKAFAQEYGVDISKWDDGLKNDDLNEKLKFVRMAELYADMILSVPDQSGLMIRPYSHFFLPINLSQYRFNPEQRKIPVIIHAPTRTGAKGTEVFIEIMDRLAKEGLQFEFHFLQNLTHSELIERLATADILLDELYFHGPGMMATEAMASGCVVVTHKLDSAKFVFDPPIFEVDINNVYDKIKLLVSDCDLRKEMGLKARTYVEEHNAGHIVCERMLTSISGVCDYTPRFFDSSFEKNASISELNKKLTEEVNKKLVG